MRITRIENSKHVQERVLVYLEEGDPLRITQNELLQFGLYQGMDLSPELVVQLQNTGRRSESRAAAARMASGRMLSRRELTDKLNRKGVDPDTAAETADWLEALGAVDDAAYAGVIARHYAAGGYGPGRVRQELQKRGIPVSCGTMRFSNCLTAPKPLTSSFARSWAAERLTAPC